MSSIDWTDEAIEAAIDAFNKHVGRSTTLWDDMRAALEAAVKAQFERLSDIGMVYAYECGHDAALEEAETALRARYMGDNNREDAEVIRCIDTIRALKETKG